MVGTTSVGALVVLGGFGVVTHFGGQPPSRLSSEEQRIVGALPAGFTGPSCRTAGSAPGGSVASLDCSNGPLQGRFTLFADADSMNRAFQDDFTNHGPDYVPSRCPGVNDSPAIWHYTARPDWPAGQIFCGTFKGAPDVEWTCDRKLLLLDVHGGHDLNSLFQWWERYGNTRRHPAFVR